MYAGAKERMLMFQFRNRRRTLTFGAKARARDNFHLSIAGFVCGNIGADGRVNRPEGDVVVPGTRSGLSATRVGSKSMRKIVKTGAAALMLTCMGGNVWAAAATASGCARPADMNALRTAAMQQRLMVAALSCGESQSYNQFVRTYQTELQESDKNLQSYFRRVNGKTGTADYHAYKTKLANSSSMAVINDSTGYCASAKASFEEALGSKVVLTNFTSQASIE